MLVETELKKYEKQSPAPNRRTRRWLWTIVAALGFSAAGSILAYYHYVDQADPVFKSAVISLGDIEKTVTALGSLKPKDYVDVGAQVSGQLKTVHVKIGDTVSAGELLAEIDPTVIETRVRADRAKLDELRAQLAQAQAELELARLQDARNTRLYKTKSVSEDTLQTGQAAAKTAAAKIDVYKAQIEQAQSTLDGDLASLGYTKIYAPLAGTVVSLDAVAGQTLNASQTAPTLLRIADLDTMTVEAQVAEADVVKIKPGMTVYFTTLGMPERRWESTVRQILPTPDLVNDVVLYKVLIDVANAEQVLMTDMTTQVFFVQGAARGVPVVPVAALQSPRGGGADHSYQVQVLKGDKTEDKSVRIGLMNRTSAEVVSGLALGDRVVTGTDNDAGKDGVADRSRGGVRIRL